MFWKVLVFWPFSLLFRVIIGIRNSCYDQNIFSSCSFDFPVIGIGNLKVGGTGKTPHTAYLADFLKENFCTGILSRGYGRKTKGFYRVTESSLAAESGDEPLIYASGFKGKVMVAVDEHRCRGVRKMRELNSELNVILLDDAFQHRKIRPGLSILLTEFSKPFFRDFLLPSGWLRESRRGASRAQIVLVTKCPDHMSAKDIGTFKQRIACYVPSARVFFTTYRYLAPVGLNTTCNPEGQAIAFAGIANTQGFFDQVRSEFSLTKTISFPDHYCYRTTDIQKIVRVFNSEQAGKKFVITTEKDAVKLKNMSAFQDLAFPVYYLPVQVSFLEDEEEFREIIDRYCKNNLPIH